MLLKKIKLIIIILFLLIIPGCNIDYQSLNDLAIVSSLLIDIDTNNEYIVFIEIYKQDKSKDNNTSFFVKGTGNNIQSAINNASNSISKKLYLVHTNAVIISKELASKKINEVFNYLESKVDMNSNYYLLVTDSINKLINLKDVDNSVLGEKISNTIKYSTNSGSMVNYDFMEKLKNYIIDDKDIYLSNIDVNNNLLTIKNGVFYNGEEMVGTLNSEELKIINLFKQTKNIYFSFKYNYDEYMLKVDKCFIKYIIDDNINIKINIKANIVEVGSNINIVKEDSITKLNNNSSKILEKKINKLLNKLKDNNSDIIGINDYISKIYGKNVKSIFNDKTIINVNVDINKKGLVNRTLGGYND